MTWDNEFMQGPGPITEWTQELLDQRWEELRGTYPDAFTHRDEEDQ